MDNKKSSEIRRDFEARLYSVVIVSVDKVTGRNWERRRRREKRGMRASAQLKQKEKM